MEDLVEEEPEIKAAAKPKHPHPEGPTIHHALGEAEKSNCGLSPPTQVPAFSCAKCHSATTGDFLGHKGFALAGSHGAQEGQPYRAAEKPRIWSLAHTAGANVIVGPNINPAQRTESPECLALQGRPTGAEGPCTEEQPLGSLLRTQSFHDKSLEDLAQPTKIFRNPSFNLQSISLNCASYPLLADTCQYSSGAEGSCPNGSFPIFPYPEAVLSLLRRCPHVSGSYGTPVQGH